VRENAQSLCEYETIYVFRPDLEDQVAIDLIQKMKGALEKQGGTHIKLSNWGRKKLAWECDRHQKGMYVHHHYLGLPGVVKEYERSLTLEESVLLRQTVLLKSNVAPGSVAPEQDQLTPPAVKERREERERESSYANDDGDRDDKGDDADYDA
jgi:small subunit ribosomal protein S6